MGPFSLFLSNIAIMVELQLSGDWLSTTLVNQITYNFECTYIFKMLGWLQLRIRPSKCCPISTVKHCTNVTTCMNARH